MPPEVIKTRAKRVFAEPQTTRTTRSKRTFACPDASVPSSSQSNGSQVQQVGNFDGDTQATIEANGPVLFDNNTHVDNQLHAIAVPEGSNQMGSKENRHSHIEENRTIGGEIIANSSVDNERTNEDVQLGGNGRRERGVNMGHGLQRMNRAMRGKLQVVIPEGSIRPLVPLVAAKFATECNIAVRNHVPVLKRWKDYENNTAIFDLFTGALKAKFNINTNDASVKKACLEMMKEAVRQQRHKLKKEFFDPFPLHLVTKSSPSKCMTDKQWNDLVEYWKNLKKMEICQKNKHNRSTSKFHHTTGSRSYAVHVENLGDKYIDQEPNALDLFKECHYSKKKKGYTPDVQLAIFEMESRLFASTEVEDEQPLSPTQVVADVLAENTKKNSFLKNVGIQNACSRSSTRNIEAQLEVEKRANSDLQAIVNAQHEQLDVLSKQVQESEQRRIREQEEMKKKQDEMEEKLQLVLSQINSRNDMVGSRN